MQTKQIRISAIAIALAVVGVVVFFLGDLNQDIQIDKYGMSANSVYTQLQKNQVFVVDIRNESEYAAGHIPGSAIDYLYDDTLEKRISTIQNRLPDVASNAKIVLVDNDDGSATTVAELMSEHGIETYYLKGGINDWDKELVTTSTPKTIDAEKLWLQIQNNEDLYLLDVRETEELEVTKIESSIHIPLAEIFEPNKLDVIPTDKPVVVICGSGNRATIASYALAQEDIDFQVLDGGIKAWDSYIEKLGA